MSQGSRSVGVSAMNCSHTEGVFCRRAENGSHCWWKSAVTSVSRDSEARVVSMSSSDQGRSGWGPSMSEVTMPTHPSTSMRPSRRGAGAVSGRSDSRVASRRLRLGMASLMAGWPILTKA